MQAYASFLKEFNWEKFVVIYENEESLVRLQEVLQYPKRYAGVKLSLHQLDPFSDDYRPMLKQIKNSTDPQKHRIILDCSFEKIERVLMNANEIDMINDYYNFFITSLVSHSQSVALTIDSLSSPNFPKGPRASRLVAVQDQVSQHYGLPHGRHDAAARPAVHQKVDSRVGARPGSPFVRKSPPSPV